MYNLLAFLLGVIMNINEIWTKLDFFTDTDAAFLWLGLEPEEKKLQDVCGRLIMNY